MKLYNLIIMNDGIWIPTVTEYLGSFTTKEKAIYAYKVFIKKASRTKEHLINIYNSLLQDYKDFDYSEVGEALQIIMTDTDELCEYDYSKSDMVAEIDVPKIFKDVVENYNKY